MTAGGKGDGFMSDINVTPFVDVMLVLLIIFMVTAPMMIQGVSVSLPEAAAKPLTADEDNLIVIIEESGQLYINDVRVTVGDLRIKLQKIIAGRTDREVYLKADKNITYGKVVKVMSEIKAAGIDKLGMVTLPANEDENGSK